MLLNLVLNARDAMPGGGRLSIEAVSVELTAAGATELLGLAPGNYLQLSVVDTGEGMTPAVLDRACEPFFTTRSARAGLGLAIARDFARQANGALRLSSEPGCGARVELLVPTLAPNPPADRS